MEAGESTNRFVAAIGAGAWGANVVRTLSGMGRLRVIAEASPALREKCRVEYPGVDVVADYREALTDAAVSAVTIATPAPTHHSIARDCLLAGRHTFVEKPLTLAADEAQDLVNAAASADRVLMVGHLLIHKPAVNAVREILKSGQLGAVRTYHQRRAKLGRARAVENSLWSLGVHDVAVILHLAGSPPVEAWASGHAGLQPGVEDDVYLHMTFPDGSKAHLHTSWLWPRDERSLVIVCKKGMIVYEEKTESVSLVRKTVDATLTNVDLGTELLYQAPADHQPLKAELEHFCECALTGRTPLTSGVAGLEVVRVLDKLAYR